MALALECVTKAARGQVWQLELEGHAVVLTDAQGQVVAQYSHDDAPAHMQLPSFSESITYFGIQAGDKMWRFKTDAVQLNQIKAYLNRRIAAKGPEAVEAVRKKAIRDTLIGVACTIVGIVISVLSYQAAANNPEGGRFHVTWGIVLVGLVMLGKGIYGFNQYGELKQQG